MRNRLLIVIAVAAVLALAGVPASAGQQTDALGITVTKVVDSPGPTGGYVVEVDCSDTGLTTLNFDAAGPDAPESQFVSAATGGGQTCTVTEVDDNGADATVYACEATGDFRCSDQQTIVVEAETGAGGATVDVINTFEEAAAPADAEADDAEPAVVRAVPTFTG